MIYKLSKDNCYSINGKLILNNRYTKIEGDVWDTGYVENLLKTDSTTLADETFGKDATDPRKFSYTDGPHIGALQHYVRYGYKFYYKKKNLGQLSSTEIMDKNINSFETIITSTGGDNEPKTAVYGIGLPDFSVDYPDTPIIGGISTNDYLEHAKKWLGLCKVYYENISSFTVTPTIYVLSKVEVWYSDTTAILIYPQGIVPPDTLGGSVNIDDTVNYQVSSTNFFQESADFSYGEDNSLLTYKIPNNELFNIDATYEENSVITGLMVKVAETILNNYKRGKQVVTVECPTLDIVNTDGEIDNQHIFEVGEYFYIENEVGNSLFYYKLTNIPKIFELISAEYVKETWTLTLKEVAIDESN